MRKDRNGKQGFEYMLQKFLKESDEKIRQLKKRDEGKKKKKEKRKRGSGLNGTESE